MSAADFLGNPIHSADEQEVRAIDGFVTGFLGYTPRILEPLTLVSAGSTHPLLNLYAGWLWMFSESPNGFAQARKYLEQACSGRSLTSRERGCAKALSCWIELDIDGAVRSLDEMLAEFPRDLATLKLHQYLNFNRGRSAEMLRVALQAMPAASDVPQLHGMLAFGYEQCHLLEEAERAAWSALELYPPEPWAHHALAHVYLTTGRICEGIRFMEDRSVGWDGLTSFMYTHNWWHLALFLLSEGRSEEVLTLYDRHIWGRDRDYSQDQVGAVSLLARLELAQVSVGERWSSLGEYLSGRVGYVVEPFLSLQYLYGLARAGRSEAMMLFQAMQRRAEGSDSAALLWRDVAVPAAAALLAHARGDYPTCVSRLSPVLGRMLEVGGSHAQRDLFSQIYIDGLIRIGADSSAQQLLEQRRLYEPNGVALNRALAGVYERLGLPRQAAQARDRSNRPRTH